MTKQPRFKFTVDWLTVCLYEESLNFGDIVFARFTHHQLSYQFKGELMGSTKNYLKVKVLENFRRGYDDVGSVINIKKTHSKAWSNNNTVLNPEWIEK